MPTRDYPTKNDVSHVVNRGFSSRIIPRLEDIILHVAGWNSADSGPNIGISNNRYSAQFIGPAAIGGQPIPFSSIRCNRYADSLVPGKYYMEAFCNASRTSGDPNNVTWGAVGFGNLAADLFGTASPISGQGTGFVGDSVNSIGFYFPQAVWYNNSAVLQFPATTYIAGAPIGIAFDTSVNPTQWWFRNSPISNWNGSPTANPATGTGGIAAAIANSVFPMLSFGRTGETITANFGETLFAGIVPAGFGPVVAANSILSDTPNGTNLALIDVLESGVAFPATGSLTFSGIDAANFQINGNRLQNATTIQRGGSLINITADTLVFRTANNPLTKAFSLTAVGGLDMSFSPSNPSWPSTTPNGTIVTTVQGINRDGRPYTGDYVFVAPNQDNGGTYDLVLNGDHSGSLRIAPSGPGVGGAGGTLQHVTVAPRE